MIHAFRVPLNVYIYDDAGTIELEPLVSLGTLEAEKQMLCVGLSEIRPRTSDSCEVCDALIIPVRS